MLNAIKSFFSPRPIKAQQQLWLEEAQRALAEGKEAQVQINHAIAYQQARIRYLIKELKK